MGLAMLRTLGDVFNLEPQPNARPELLPEAGARHERTLEAVSSRPLLAARTLDGQQFSCWCSCQAGAACIRASPGVALTLEQEFCDGQAEEKTPPHGVGTQRIDDMLVHRHHIAEI